MIWIAAVLVIAILVFVLWFRRTSRQGCVIIGNGNGTYVRLRPNPGFTVRNFHWCKARGHAEHVLPTKIEVNDGPDA